jgi:hypothetical protein
MSRRGTVRTDREGTKLRDQLSGPVCAIAQKSAPLAPDSHLREQLSEKTPLA